MGALILHRKDDGDEFIFEVLLLIGVGNCETINGNLRGVEVKDRGLKDGKSRYTLPSY